MQKRTGLCPGIPIFSSCRCAPAPALTACSTSAAPGYSESWTGLLASTGNASGGLIVRGKRGRSRRSSFTDDGSDTPMMDVLGLKASEAHFIVDPYEGVQVTDNDVSHLRRVVERYLQDKG